MTETTEVSLVSPLFYLLKLSLQFVLPKRFIKIKISVTQFRNFFIIIFFCSIFKHLIVAIFSKNKHFIILKLGQPGRSPAQRLRQLRKKVLEIHLSIYQVSQLWEPKYSNCSFVLMNFGLAFFIKSTFSFSPTDKFKIAIASIPLRCSSMLHDL